MGVSGGPYIVRDSSLVLELDAADRNSYVSGSSTWYDLTANNNSGSLTNGPTFSNNSIVFDGVNDYATTNYIPLFASDFYISLWIRFNTYQIYQNPVSSANDGNATQGFWLEFGTARGFTLYNTATSLALEDNVVDLRSLSTNVWYNVCVNRLGTNSNNLKLYINNVVCGQNTYTTTIGHPLQALELSRYAKNATTLFLNGSISNMQIYSNRGLTPSEILQNYNALKSRFNL